MASLLTEAWLEGLGAVAVHDEGSVSVARTTVRAESARAGLDTARSEALAAATSELVRNQLLHARRGRFAVHAIRRSGTPAVEIVCADEGPGISDPAKVFREEPRPSGGLGAGLAGVLRLADEVDFDVRAGEGTCVRARKFARPVPRRETAVLGRPHQGAAMSGDDAAVVWCDDALLIAVADGLGHGEAAREASRRAVSVVRREAVRPLDEIFHACAPALEQTRGVVMSVIRLEAGQAWHAGVGNVQVRLYGADRTLVARFTGVPGVLDARRGKTRVRIEEATLPERYLLLAFTDGLSSRVDVSETPEAFLAPPLAGAQLLLERFGSAHDDALIIVAR
jgi:anti-sigma regulatory factor (Ser/Thr protein kinase)